MQFLQMILSVFVLFLCACPIVSNPRQEMQASGNEVDLDDEGMLYIHMTTFSMLLLICIMQVPPSRLPGAVTGRAVMTSGPSCVWTRV